MAVVESPTYFPFSKSRAGCKDDYGAGAGGAFLGTSGVLVRGVVAELAWWDQDEDAGEVCEMEWGVQRLGGRGGEERLR